MTIKNNKYGIMKGLAIIGVVAGHAGIDVVETFVNYWHLPVFFFISGYFLKPRHVENWKQYVRSRVNRLIVPFLLFAIGATVFHNLLVNCHIIEGNAYEKLDYLYAVRQLLFLSSREQLIGAIWFLPALFIVSLFGISSIKLINDYKLGTYIWGG